MKHFQYVLLFVLGISFLSVDYKLDALDLREGEYDFTVQVYSDYLDRQIASSENWFLKYSMKYSPIKEGIFDAQFGVIEFFNRMRFNNKINLHQRLMDVIEVLNPRFYAPKSIYGFNEIGVSILDAKQLYIKYLNPLNYGMCNYQCNIYNLHSVYDERSELFISKLGFEELNSDYTLSYMGIEYRLGPDQLDIKFSEKDIEKGFAEVKIQGILTGQVKSIDIELPKYAFSY